MVCKILALAAMFILSGGEEKYVDTLQINDTYKWENDKLTIHSTEIVLWNGKEAIECFNSPKEYGAEIIGKTLYYQGDVIHFREQIETTTFNWTAYQIYIMGK